MRLSCGHHHKPEQIDGSLSPNSPFTSHLGLQSRVTSNPASLLPMPPPLSTSSIVCPESSSCLKISPLFSPYPVPSVLASYPVLSSVTLPWFLAGCTSSPRPCPARIRTYRHHAQARQTLQETQTDPPAWQCNLQLAPCGFDTSLTF